MNTKEGDVIGLFGSTDSYRVLHVMSDNEVLGRCDLSGHETIINLSDVFICASYNDDGTIIKTYWDGIVIKEPLDGDYMDRDDVLLSEPDDMAILLDFLGRDVASD